MGADTLKIKRSGGDGTGKRERVSRAEGGAAIIGQIIRDDMKRFGLRPCQKPGAGTIGRIGGRHRSPRANRDDIVCRGREGTDRGKQVCIRDGVEVRKAPPKRSGSR